jgi:hypothetical protein
VAQDRYLVNAVIKYKILYRRKISRPAEITINLFTISSFMQLVAENGKCTEAFLKDLIV